LHKTGLAPETKKDLLNSLFGVALNPVPPEAYKKKLREAEVHLVYNYKKELDAGHYRNFEPIFTLLKRFQFFSSYKQGHCQKIVEQAQLLIFKQSDLIFKQG